MGFVLLANCLKSFLPFELVYSMCPAFMTGEDSGVTFLAHPARPLYSGAHMRSWCITLATAVASPDCPPLLVRPVSPTVICSTSGIGGI